MKLPMGAIRRQVETLMTDTATITRKSGEGAWDQNTGTYSGSAETTLYSGPALVSVMGGPTADRAGGQTTAEVDYWLSIPISEDDDYQPGDVVTVTAVGENSDPSLLGEEFTIDADQVGTYAASRRFRMRRVQEVPGD